MPTPVTTARQCLTDEAARALNDAVSVAKRRNHAQTTSLHAVSALLSPSFTLLRESLSRARSSAFSPRLQLRALDLCVSVSLDRLPTSKSSNSTEVNDDFAPPISNSLMAAIKRSQAHQRRQPDMYHLSQINHINNNSNNNNGTLSISCIKVELKHFVLSILDDPIISRVLGEAGFRSTDIKLGIIHPPRWTAAGMIPRRPPLFLCNFTGSGFGVGIDENCRRISEVMARKKGGRNPVLIGVSANDALIRFKENVIINGGVTVIKELIGVKLVCLMKEIKEKDSLGLEVKIQEAKSKAESKTEAETEEEGIQVVVNLGEISELISGDEVVIKKVSGLVEECGNKVRLIMEAKDYEMYSKLIWRFPTVDKDWNLQPVPITASSSSSSSSTSFDPKSSLMGSFVPFGGFFPTPSDFSAPLTAVRQPFIRCNACNESYERELRAVLNEGSLVSVSGDQSSSMPSWLQRAETDPSKAGNTVAQVSDVRTEKISHLQKKWDENCRLVHQKYPFPIPPVSLPYLQVSPPLGFPLMANVQGSRSSSGDSSLNERACSNSNSSIQTAAQNISPQQQVMKPDFPKRSIEIAECHPPHYPLSTVPVSTDLGLGVICAPKSENTKKHFLQDHYRHSNHGGVSMEPDFGDYKALFRKLTEVVPWQSEAICRITEIVSSCQIRKSIWVNFVGPDKMGQKRIAQTLADAIHGRKDSLISLNLSCQDRTTMPNSLFQGMNEFDINSSRITLVDHIAQELSKKPQLVVFLENVDEADPLVQNSLTRAILTGKFPDSKGNEVGTNNVVFVTTSRGTNNEKNLSPRREFIKFLEEKVLEAKNWEMQLAIRSVPCRSNETTVSLLSPKYPSAKRKLFNFSNSPEDLDETKRPNKMTKKFLDLNLPLEDSKEMDCYEGGPNSDMSKAWLKEFLNQVDGNVAFKAFDFDALADGLLRKMRSKLEETLSQGQRILLEIDHEVMLQVLAATWFADEKGAVDEWIKDVLGSSLSEARERYHVSDESVVRLGSSEGVLVKEWARGIRLPRRINLSI